jgi:uncharacterized protein (TIGR00255 family)
MTGFGESRLQDERWSVSVEVRTVNNRHLKLNARISDPYGALEPEFERLVRESLRRGSVNLSVRVERPRRPEDYRINPIALKSYADQIESIQGRPVNLSELLDLPGVVEDQKPVSDNPQADWPALASVVSDALRKLQAARLEEGQVMERELLVLGKAVATQVSAIAERGPVVVSSYQKRLITRVQALVESQGVTVEPKDVIREMAIFGERADVSEEIVRLRAHLAQYLDVIQETESAGRKLEFVVQEMSREANTIGSKANDVEISRAVVEIKGVLEKIRELIQNVE